MTSTAPASRALSIRPPLAMPMTRTPRSASEATRSRPTDPAAPQTRAVEPRSSGQWRTSPAAVTAPCARLAPSSKLRLSGRGANITAGATTNVAHDPNTPVQHTRASVATSTSGPAATTTPAPSKPTAYGNGNLIAYVLGSNQALDVIQPDGFHPDEYLARLRRRKRLDVA